MDIQTQLLKEHSKQNAELIAKHIGSDSKKFDQLMTLFFYEEYRITQRAAHVLSHCADHIPALITPYVKKMIDYLNTDPKVAIKRNTVRILQNQVIPISHQGKLTNYCFDYLLSNGEPIAIKVFSMTILANMAQTYPDLINELKIVVENLLQNKPSAGIRSRAIKTLKRLAEIAP